MLEVSWRPFQFGLSVWASQPPPYARASVRCPGPEAQGTTGELAAPNSWQLGPIEGGLAKPKSHGRMLAKILSLGRVLSKPESALRTLVKLVPWKYFIASLFSWKCLPGTRFLWTCFPKPGCPVSVWGEFGPPEFFLSKKGSPGRVWVKYASPEHVLTKPAFSGIFFFCNSTWSRLWVFCHNPPERHLET